MLIQSFATMITALIVAFVFVWELTLVMLIFMPIMVLSGNMQDSLLRGYSKNDKEGVEDGGKVGLQVIPVVFIHGGADVWCTLHIS